MNNHMVWNHGDLLLIVKDVELGQTLKIQKNHMVGTMVQTLYKHKESHGSEPWQLKVDRHSFKPCASLCFHSVCPSSTFFTIKSKAIPFQMMTAMKTITNALEPLP